MALQLEAVSFDVPEALEAAAFWAVLLDRNAIFESTGALLPSTETQVGLRFITSAAPQIGPRQLHLHVTSESLEHQQQTVERALHLGARHLDVGQGADAPLVVLSDPGGNELCVIEPDNAYLQGTGPLGEVTCDGAREVGVFWRDALGWPLVLDEDGHTAIQSPSGGTKISWDPWEHPPSSSDDTRLRQRFDLLADDLDAEVERLVALGATARELGIDYVDLQDPGGKDFTIRPA